MPDKLAAMFGDVVDLSLVGDDWVDKGEGSLWEPTFEKLESRSREARVFLRRMVEGLEGGGGHIVVVTHGAIVHYLTQDWHRLGNGRCELLSAEIPVRVRYLPVIC